MTGETSNIQSRKAGPNIESKTDAPALRRQGYAGQAVRPYQLKSLFAPATGRRGNAALPRINNGRVENKTAATVTRSG
jgi:hypothetical protein